MKELAAKIQDKGGLKPCHVSVIRPKKIILLFPGDKKILYPGGRKFIFLINLIEFF